MDKLKLALLLLLAIPCSAQDYQFNNLRVKGGSPWIDVKTYGATGNGSTDDTTAIQTAITACSTAQGILFFPLGAYKITTALSVTSNCRLQGELFAFGSEILPVGAIGCFKLDGPGAAGGFIFDVIIQDITCDMTSASTFTGDVVLLDHVYQVEVNRIRISPVPDHDSNNGILIQGSNHIKLDHPVIYGPSVRTHQPTGIKLDGSTYDNFLTTIYSADVENFYTNYYVTYDNQVDIISGYNEGAIINIVVNPNNGTSVNIYGGLWPSVNGSTYSMENVGSQTSALVLHDPHIQLGSGANLFFGPWTGSIQESDNGAAWRTVTSLPACAANGTAANPSVVSCSAAPSGMFSCATNASTTTCQVNTTAVTANSVIEITQTAADGGAGQLNVTCNTTSVLPSAKPIVLSKSAGANFILNMGTITTNPGCFEFRIIN